MRRCASDQSPEPSGNFRASKTQTCEEKYEVKHVYGSCKAENTVFTGQEDAIFRVIHDF